MTTPENPLPLGIPKSGPSYRGALKSRDFTLLFVGQVGSEIGNGAVQLALPFLVLDISDSALQLGLAYFFQFLPMLLFGILGGVFVDRWDRRLTIVVVDAIRAVGFISVAVIYYLGALTVEHIYAVIFMESTLANFFNPARVALLPNLVSPDDLRPANSLMEIARYIGFLIAPPAGGVVVGLLGPASIMLFDGLTFLIATVCVFFIRWRPPPRVVQQAESFSHAVSIVIQQTKEGLQAIFRTRLLQIAVLLGFSLNLIIAPIQVLIPLFVTDVKGQGGSYFGIMVAGLLVGLVAGSLAAPLTARSIGLGRLTIVAVLVLGVVIAIASWPVGLWPPVVAMLIAGIAIGSLNVAQQTMLQTATNDAERGRVSATFYTFSLGVRPFSFLATGALATGVDIRWMFVVLGILALSVGAVLARLKEVREYA